MSNKKYFAVHSPTGDFLVQQNRLSLYAIETDTPI